MRRVNQAFLDYGYSGLSMVVTGEALRFHHFNKKAAFRAVINYRNDEAVALAREAGKSIRANGGSALDILAEILDIRYGETRRMVIGSPHTVELNAEAFKRRRDLMIQSAVDFQRDVGSGYVVGIDRADAPHRSRQLPSPLVSRPRS